MSPVVSSLAQCQCHAELRAGGRQQPPASSPRVPSLPEHQPRCPPEGVTTSRQLGLAASASRGMASTGAMGSSAACTTSSGIATLPMTSAEELPA